MRNEKSDGQENNKLVWILGFISVVFVFVSLGFTYYTLIEDKESDRGTFGDMFGGVNALFSGLAFAGIIVTILLQGKELSLQRKELKATTLELERTANAQEKTEFVLSAQLDMMKTQQFEASFFNLLKNHEEVISRPFRKLLNEDITNTKQFLSTYTSSIIEHRFLSYKSTKYHPNSMYKASPIFKNIGRSILHIANYIERSIQEDQKAFYHQTIYYNITDDEKFLLGMIIKNELEPNVNFAFEYCAFYNEMSSYKNKSETGFFPSVRIKVFHGLTQIWIPSYRILKDHMHLFKNAGYYIESDSTEVKLSKIRYIVKDGDKSSTVTGEFEVEKDTADLSKMFLDTNLQTFIKVNGTLYFNLEFIFDYRGSDYTICANPTIQLQVEHIDEEKLKYRTDAKNVAIQFDVKEIIQFTLSDADELERLHQKMKL